MPTIQFFQPDEGRHFEGPLDLNAHLIRHPAATFFLRAGPDVPAPDGAGRRDAGVRADDLLVIDRSVRPSLGTVIIAVHDGELRVERFRHEETLEVWGAVTHLIRRL